MGKQNSNFQRSFSFTRVVGKATLNFYFTFLVFYYIENEIRIAILVFLCPLTSYNRIAIDVKCVFLSHVSANRFPATLENGIRTSSFVFRSPTPSEKETGCLFLSRFPTILKTKFEFLFSFFVFA